MRELREPICPNRGAELLVKWRGKRHQIDIVRLLGTDKATYNRLERGMRRPVAEMAVKIELLTGGEVPAKSWYVDARGHLRGKHGRRAA